MIVSLSEDQKTAINTYRGPDLKLFVRDVRDRQGRKRAITVRSWSSIKDVKDVIRTLLQVPPSAQRLYYGPLLTSGGELPNHRTLHDAGIYRSGETLLLDIQTSSHNSNGYSSNLRSTGDVSISSSMIDATPRRLRTIVQRARRGLALGLKPNLVLDGSGGTYFLHDAHKNHVAVFKPGDEEPYAENNPRGYLQQPGQHLSLREGIAPGEACIREVAAYLLDHDGFSGVPMTTLAEARHPAFNINGARLKVSEGGASVGWHSTTPNSPVKPASMRKAGSFQEFIRCECTMDDLSPSKITAEEIHKIAILDIRVMNADRNSANLLCRRLPDNTLVLVPIDHGYCLRSVCDVSWMDWCWLDWPQMKEPLSDKSKMYILNLDIEADARLLRERLSICEDAIDNFRASSLLLKAGVKAGLTLYDIAIMCCRNDNMGEIPSKLESLSTMASELASIAVENERWHHSAASRALVEQLTPTHGYVVSRDRLSTKRFHKSVSSAEFTSFANESMKRIELDNDRVAEFENLSPGRAQSSGSDSSTESVEAVVVDDCEEWAAHIIADVSVELPSAPPRKARCSSVTSEDGDSILSSSPKGFWSVAPGRSPPISDDGSCTWSPQFSSSPHGSEHSVGPTPPPLLRLPRAESSKSDKRASVTFADLVPSCGPPSTVSKFKPKAKLAMSFAGMTRTDFGMARSKSYSALSNSLDSSSCTSRARKTPQAIGLSGPFTEDFELYRMYFLKFIDLVVVRETTSAIYLLSKNDSTANLPTII